MSNNISNNTLHLYTLGSGAVGVKNLLFGSWLLVYFNQILGLEPLLASYALAIALVFDAISDPLVGAWSDRFKSKWGRRHPFVYLAIIPFGLSAYFLYSIPTDTSQTALFIKLLIASILLRTLFTFYETPRAAIGPELITDYERRNTLSGYGVLYGNMGLGIMSYAMLAFFLVETETFSGSRAFLNPEAYPKFGLLACILIIIFGFISSLSTHKYIPDMVEPEPKQFKFSEFWREILESLSNRNWLVLFTAGTILALNIGIFSSLDNYFSIYFWQWTPEEISLFPIIIALPVVLAGFFAAPLAKGKSKKNFAIGLFLINLIVEPMPIWLRLLDPYVPIQIFPENGTDALWWTIITFLCIGYFLRTAGWILVISMVYDVVEDGQLATGRRDEGLYLSANGFIQKIISGLGVVFVGFLLEFVGFDVKNPTVIEMQEPIYRLAYFQAILGPILTLASISCMFFYNISKSSHEDALKSLEINKD